MIDEVVRLLTENAGGLYEMSFVSYELKDDFKTVETNFLNECKNHKDPLANEMYQYYTKVKELINNNKKYKLTTCNHCLRGLQEDYKNNEKLYNIIEEIIKFEKLFKKSMWEYYDKYIDN
ncbi:MAG: hypothetical protein ACOC2W_00700 [bacterium]